MPDRHDGPPPARPQPTRDVAAWSDAPLRDVVDHLLATYHRPLEAELPRLVALAEGIEADLGDQGPAPFGELVETLRALAQSLLDHMLKEEQILFPLIERGEGAQAEGPIRVMGMEHEAAADHLARLRQLTGGYEVPEAACRSWRGLWQGLANLDADLQVHIRFEDEVLFPRALAEP